MHCISKSGTTGELEHYVFGKYILFAIHNFLYHTLVTKFIPQNKLFKNKACHFLKSKRGKKPYEYKFIARHNCSQNEMNFTK